MLLLNFAHPLTEAHCHTIEAMTGQSISELVERMPHFDDETPFAAQVNSLVASLEIAPDRWQTIPILVNPPGYAPAAGVLLAVLHGLMGHFPALLRVRPVVDSTPTRYEIAEIVNLQAVRELARQER